MYDKTLSKKKKDYVNSELSEDISSKDNGITTPHGFPAMGKTHKGGSSKKIPGFISLSTEKKLSTRSKQRESWCHKP